MANRFQTVTATASLLLASLIGFDASAQTYSKTVVADGDKLTRPLPAISQTPIRRLPIRSLGWDMVGDMPRSSN